MINGVVRHCTKAGHTCLETEKKKRFTRANLLYHVHMPIIWCRELEITLFTALPEAVSLNLNAFKISNLFFMWKKRAVLSQIDDNPKPVHSVKHLCVVVVSSKIDFVASSAGSHARVQKLHKIYKTFSLVKCQEHARILTVQSFYDCSWKSKIFIVQQIKEMPSI